MRQIVRRRRTQTVRTCVTSSAGAPSSTKTVKREVYIGNGKTKKTHSASALGWNSVSKWRVEPNRTTCMPSRGWPGSSTLVPCIYREGLRKSGYHKKEKQQNYPKLAAVQSAGGYLTGNMRIAETKDPHVLSRWQHVQGYASEYTFI